MNSIHSIHYMDGRVVVFHLHNELDYTPTPTSLERLTKLLRRITPFNAFVLPYPNGWSVTFNAAVYHHLNIVNNGGKLPGAVCSPPSQELCPICGLHPDCEGYCNTPKHLRTKRLGVVDG